MARLVLAINEPRPTCRRHKDHRAPFLLLLWAVGFADLPAKSRLSFASLETFRHIIADFFWDRQHGGAEASRHRLRNGLMCQDGSGSLTWH